MPGSSAWLHGWEIATEARDRAGRVIDLLVTVPLPKGGKALLCVECKKELRPSEFRQFADLFQPALHPAKAVVPVLGLPSVSPRTDGVAAYAAFSAADFQAPHVRQPKTWLYVRDANLPAFEDAIDAKQVESGENLVVLIPDDDGVFYQADAGNQTNNRLACTNEVQTYVDLCHCGGRGAEAAEALLEQCLKPKWKAGETTR